MLERFGFSLFDVWEVFWELCICSGTSNKEYPGQSGILNKEYLERSRNPISCPSSKTYVQLNMLYLTIKPATFFLKSQICPIILVILVILGNPEINQRLRFKEGVGLVACCWYYSDPLGSNWRRTPISYQVKHNYLSHQYWEVAFISEVAILSCNKGGFSSKVSLSLQRPHNKYHEGFY